MAAWHLFEPVSKILGPTLSAKHFLESILRIYESADPTAKHLKLYHRSFVLTLIVCFGTKTFLKVYLHKLRDTISLRLRSFERMGYFGSCRTKK